MKNIYRVQGLLAYTSNALIEFEKLKPTINELKYSIEQFRIIEKIFQSKLWKQKNIILILIKNQILIKLIRFLKIMRIKIQY